MSLTSAASTPAATAVPMMSAMITLAVNPAL
jgi:hypothetical protein